jgi:hypothetical protein
MSTSFHLFRLLPLWLAPQRRVGFGLTDRLDSLPFALDLRALADFLSQGLPRCLGLVSRS